MSIEVVTVLGSAIGGLISFFFGYSVGRWAKSRAFRSTISGCDVQRIVVNPSSDNPRTFVPESENAKLRGLVRDAHALATDNGVDVRYPYCDAWDEKLAVVEKQMRELGIEV